jgi:SAM-dependent methyltransferase
MKESLISSLRCTKCASTVSIAQRSMRDGEIETGLLACPNCSNIYQIQNFIPRFVSSGNYANSFGFQWNRFQKTQLDSYTGTTISRDRFIRQTAWNPATLSGATVLDAGCGAGRFSEIALSHGSRVFAIDYSMAVEATWRNLGSHPNLHVVQADLQVLPFPDNSFDYIYCFGVLQHTPRPQDAFLALTEKLKPEGRIAVDIYPKTWRTPITPRHWLRPITTRLPGATLFRMTERSVPFLLPMSRMIGRLPYVGSSLRKLVPVADYEDVYPLNEQQLREWAVLDTFDMLSPAYDKPQTPDTLRSWLSKAELEDIEVVRMEQLVARGRKAAS